MKVTAVLGLGLAFALAPLTSAGTIDFTTDSSDSGTMGNALCYTSTGVATSCSGGQFVTITAWGVTGGAGGNTTFAQGALGQYYGADYGLGVCNQSEGTDCGSPNHEVNNNGHLDFVLFQFSNPLNSAAFVLNPVCDCGFTDSTYYVGNATGSISGLSLSGLGAMGFGPGVSNTGGNSQQNLSIPGIGGGITSILIGADIGGPHSGDDYFKIGSLTYTIGGGGGGQDTPEPLSFVLAGTGLIGMYFVRRRLSSR